VSTTEVAGQEGGKTPGEESDRERLLAQCDVTTFRASGPGGQHRNRRESGVRLKHRPTGIVVTATERRSQHQNRAVALDRLERKLKALRKRRKKRRPTRPTAASRERRAADKKRRSATKRTRGRVTERE